MSNEDVRKAALAYTRMRHEYEYHGGIFDTDEPRVAAAKRALSELDVADRAIFTLYTDLGSIRATARLLGMGRDSIHKEVKRIRRELKQRI